MAKSEDLANEIWGTWEELLLGCAVSRHGTRSWDSVAVEIQTRSPFSDLLTPQICRQRFFDLKRRFESAHDSNLDQDSDPSAGVPWLDELRKLRMAELRREVDRYDVSITSLQSKLKNLRAEREKSEADAGEQSPPDLKKGEAADDKGGGSQEPVGDSGGSCKESNSTDPKAKGAKSGELEETEPEKTAAAAQEAMVRPAREASCNGSSETADMPPPCLESSDVQSSVSLSRRRRGRLRKPMADETEAVSPVAALANPIIAPQSQQPLASFLYTVRSSKHGAIFLRRLQAQESGRYRRVIRKHVDLEMVRGRLERRGTEYSTAEFFRDLLLLCNNAIVFFPKGSPNSAAAVHLRQMVTAEMAAVLPKRTHPMLAPATSLSLRKPLTKLKLDSDLSSNPLPKKSRSPGSLVACRKRTSVSKHPAVTAPPAAEDSDSDSDGKTRERPKVSGARGLRTSKSRGNSGSKSSRLGPIADDAQTPETKAEKRTNPMTPKKRNAANFLNRLKGSPAESLLNSLKKRGSGKGEGKRSVGRPPKKTATPSPPPTKRLKIEAPPLRRPPPPPPVKRRGKK